MEAAQPRSTARRARRGSLERPLDTRLVRKTALVLVLPLLLLALTVARPGALASPTLPPSFDGAAATAQAQELARDYPSRVPGSSGAAGAARWFVQQLAPYGLVVETDAWREALPDLGSVELRNLAVVVPGRTASTIVFAAHRDNDGVGAGANDNASGTAALVQLARAYGESSTRAGRAVPLHRLVFLSTDGGAYGSVGARRFARSSSLRQTIVAVVSLEGLAGRTRPRLELAGAGGRSPAPTLVRTAATRVAEQLGEEPARPSVLRQLVDLGIPFAYGEQAPFLGERLSAIRLTAADDSGRSAAADLPASLDPGAFERLGRAAEALLGSLDSGLELSPETSAYVYLGGRLARGWALQLTLFAALLPFAAGAVDLAVRCRRRGIPLAPAFRALRRRLGFWLWVGLLLWIADAAGMLPDGSPVPLAPGGASATDWPLLGTALLVSLAVAGWWGARQRILPTRPARSDEQLAGYAAAFIALAAVALLTASLSPFALIFVLPSLYAWLWLPQVESRWLQDLLVGLGLVGPAVAVVSLAERFHLGIDVFLYLAGLVGVGYLSWATVVALLAWLAVAGQVAALASGRYAPYAGGAVPPPPGALRLLVARWRQLQSRRR